MIFVITGPVCSGKTTIGKQLSTEMGIPFETIDTFVRKAYEVETVKTMLALQYGVSDLVGVKTLDLTNQDIINFLEYLTYPYVQESVNEFVKSSKNVILEIPLYEAHGKLVENFEHKRIDIIIDSTIHIHRLYSRYDFHEAFNALGRYNKRKEQAINRNTCIQPCDYVINVVNNDIGQKQAYHAKYLEKWLE